MSEQIATGAVAYGPDGPIAFVRDVALSPVTLEATWLVLSVRDSTHTTAVPTAAASVDSTGAVRIPFTHAQLLAAPSVGGTVDAHLGAQLNDALGLA